MNRLQWNRSLLLAAAAVLLGGCTMAPKYTRPTAPVPATLPSGSAYGPAPATAGAVPVSEMPWREFISDERLQKIITTALENNRDLRIAALNVDRARALYGIQRAEMLPTVDATGSMNKQRIPANVQGFPEPMTLENYGVNLGVVSWEIDFFGRIRSLNKVALQEFFATEQARRSAQILLVSGVADAYYTLATDRENLKLAETTLETQQAVYDLVKQRFDHGRVSELDVHRAQAQVDTARGDTARFTQLVAQDVNALNLLVGAPVPNNLLPSDLGHASPPRDISPGTSSAVLLQRPDILEAEDHLKAANANIGAARAAFFPRISLTAAIGTASSDLSGLFKSGSFAWNYAPQIALPIFDARTWSAAKVSEADKKIAIAQYEKAIQTSFREVADALAIRDTVDQEVAAQESLVHSEAETYRLSNVRYTKGIDSYLSVLDAQRSLYAAQQGLVSLRLAKLVNQMRLYAVLGGGWQVPKTPTKGAEKDGNHASDHPAGIRRGVP